MLIWNSKLQEGPGDPHGRPGTSPTKYVKDSDSAIDPHDWACAPTASARVKFRSHGLKILSARPEIPQA